MKKITVSKLQIAQAKQCTSKCEKYSQGLSAIVSLCELVLPFSQYNKLPDEFRLEQKSSVQTIIRDLKSMIKETQDMADKKRIRSQDLANKRAEELKEL